MRTIDYTLGGYIAVVSVLLVKQFTGITCQFGEQVSSRVFPKLDLTDLTGSETHLQKKHFFYIF